MSCKSAIYTVNSTSTAVASGGIIPLGSIIRRYGQNIQLNGNGINLNGLGYYKVDASISVASAVAGSLTATLFDNGVAVTGGTATATASAIGDVLNLNINAIVRETCCNSNSTLTLVLSGGAGTTSNVSVTVEKL